MEKMNGIKFFAVASFPLLLALLHCSPSGVEPLPKASCPEIKITDVPTDSLRQDGFTLKTISIEVDKLFLEITHGGGCKQHDYELFMSPSVFAESFPVQASLYLRHNANGDLCKALLQPKLCFDLRPVAEQYRRFYGGLAPIRLNMHGYSSGQKLDALYEPQ
jgi:hypothetical protein